MTRNTFYFEIEVLPEQIAYANELVDYSLKHHPVKDIFANDPGGIERQREFRLTGSLGEIVFADTYKLPRPKRSFGAIDGQDFGRDFSINFHERRINFDIKTMRRNDHLFRENYVLNIPGYQILKSINITDSFFCINLYHRGEIMIAAFVGWVDKEEILSGRIGKLYKSGSKRIKDDGTFFVFQRDTYEVEFKHFRPPFVNQRIEKMKGFNKLQLLPALSPRKQNPAL